MNAKQSDLVERYKAIRAAQKKADADARARGYAIVPWAEAEALRKLYSVCAKEINACGPPGNWDEYPDADVISKALRAVDKARGYDA